ncbi:MAG: threonine synthase [Bacillota bacterium]|nr:threonine synthase [Bacillota bacterium]
MNYCSTRGKEINVTSAEAIKNGLAPDGGLYVPTQFPAVSVDEMKKMLSMNYIDRAVFILSRFLTDFTADELQECAKNAYTGKFDSATPAPTVKLTDNEYVCELWHGPTCAFKDMALQILPHLLKASIKKTGEDKTVVILVATSGDTGKAALEGFKDVNGTKIIVFYPNDGVSDIQKLQMVTQEGGNVAVFAINGNFDNAQTGVKDIFSDPAFGKEMSDRGYVFSSANSINFGRLVPQVVYYFSSYLDLAASGAINIGDKVNFAVPTGNFGNILAAYYAMRMGLPVNRLICASNRNSVLTDFINTGVYDRNRDFYCTISPSMDILISSNLERLLFELSGRDDKLVLNLMGALKKDGRYTVPNEVKNAMSSLFWGGFIDDEATKAVINENFRNSNYIPDTHTSVALGVYEKYLKETGDKTKTIVMSTASPFKFAKDVLDALGTKTDFADYRLLSALEDEYKIKMPAPLKDLNKKEVRFKEVFEKDEMRKAVSSALK